MYIGKLLAAQSYEQACLRGYSISNSRIVLCSMLVSQNYWTASLLIWVKYRSSNTHLCFAMYAYPKWMCIHTILVIVVLRCLLGWLPQNAWCLFILEYVKSKNWDFLKTVLTIIGVFGFMFLVSLWLLLRTA